ncbi:immunoglobulin-like domain-containing protein [Salimicrobium sp. PL1-032A]|uniref:immunoglobulin-like domain-containing protein n=1 Tax=Salimicrobium sp. PL1-032A TaxID=3095364 RepID=UPI00326059B0
MRYVVLIAILLLGGCQSGFATSEYGSLPHTKHDITFQAESEISPDEQGVRFYITNTGEEAVFYDVGYRIEKEREGEWMEVPFEDKPSFRERDRKVNPGESFESAVLLEELEAAFEDGMYRVIVTMTTERDTEQEFMLASEFEVTSS